MKLLIPIAAAVAALSVTVGAQDTTVKSRTKIKGDDAQVVNMTGCLRQDVGGYALVGTVGSAGHELKTESKVKRDVDKHGTKVTTTTNAKADHNGSVATTGVMSTYALVPGNGVNLSPYVGQQVQLSAATVKPGHHDGNVKIEDKTTVDPEHGRDTTSRSKTKIEVPRTAYGQYTVVSVKPLGTACSAQ